MEIASTVCRTKNTLTSEFSYNTEMRLPDGVISPGAIGYDINCGVRLLASDAANLVVSEETVGDND